MRSSVKLLATVAGAFVLVATGSVLRTSADLTPDQQNALETQRAALVAQLDALLPSQRGAAAQLGSAEGTYMSAQSQTLGAQAQLDAINTQLAQLKQQIAQDQKTSTDAKSELAELTRQMYETSDSNGIVNAVLSSNSFGDAMNQIQGARATNAKLADLQNTLTQQDKQLADEETDLQGKIASSQQIEASLDAKSNQFLLAVDSRNLDLAHASAPVRALEAQIANIDNEIAAGESPGGSVSDGPCGNHFSFGQCTWYVATRRCVPWIGNADQWYYAAAADGYAEGHSPVVGAIVVFWPGGDGASGVGHVGYVEAVGPGGGVPPGYFKMSEMNFNGWDQVDYRVLPSNSSGIQGFIYGHN